MNVSSLIKQLINVQSPSLHTSETTVLETSPEIQNFLHDMNVLSIYICIAPAETAKNKITILNDLNKYEPDVEYLVLTKLKPSVITVENFGHLVRFVPISKSPLNTLYQTIHSVFTPMLKEYF
jgi:dynein heavy chain 2